MLIPIFGQMVTFSDAPKVNSKGHINKLGSSCTQFGLFKSYVVLTLLKGLYEQPIVAFTTDCTTITVTCCILKASQRSFNCFSSTGSLGDPISISFKVSQFTEFVNWKVMALRGPRGAIKFDPGRLRPPEHVLKTDR